MDWKLEVVVVPVTDVDRAKSFYIDKLGFRLDADTQPTPAMRVVHMTPPGSACSVVIGPVVVARGCRPRAGREHAAGRHRHRGRPRPADRARRRGLGDPDAGSPGWREVRLLQRSRRQQLGRPGDPRASRRGAWLTTRRRVSRRALSGARLKAAGSRVLLGKSPGGAGSAALVQRLVRCFSNQ